MSLSSKCTCGPKRQSDGHELSCTMSRHIKWLAVDRGTYAKDQEIKRELVKMLKTVHREGAGRHYEAISELIVRAEGKNHESK